MNFDFKRMLKFEHNVGEKEKKYRLYGGPHFWLFHFSSPAVKFFYYWWAWFLLQPVIQAGARFTQGLTKIPVKLQAAQLKALLQKAKSLKAQG